MYFCIKFNYLLLLADFWSRYEVVYGKGIHEDEPTDDNYDNEDEKVKKNMPTYQLKVVFST